MLVEMTSEKWDEYWNNKKKNQLFKAFRTQVFARAVRYYTNKYFAREGVIVEAGCGSGEASSKISKYGRKIIAVDFSERALERARKINLFDECVNSDIKNLPFEDNSLAGIWNIGVMEHFEEDEGIKIINDFYDKLEGGGYVIMFWASEIAHYHLCIKYFNKLFKKNFELFPDEPNRMVSKKHAKEIMAKTKFERCEVFFSWRDLFTDMVVVAKK